MHKHIVLFLLFVVSLSFKIEYDLQETFKTKNNVDILIIMKEQVNHGELKNRLYKSSWYEIGRVVLNEVEYI